MDAPSSHIPKLIRRVSPQKALADGQYHTIARKSGLSPQHVSRTIKGERGCSFHIAYRIAYAAGVTLDQLYYFIHQSSTLAVKHRATRKERGYDKAKRLADRLNRQTRQAQARAKIRERLKVEQAERRLAAQVVVPPKPRLLLP